MTTTTPERQNADLRKELATAKAERAIWVCNPSLKPIAEGHDTDMVSVDQRVPRQERAANKAQDYSTSGVIVDKQVHRCQFTCCVAACTKRLTNVLSASQTSSNITC